MLLVETGRALLCIPIDSVDIIVHFHGVVLYPPVPHVIVHALLAPIFGCVPLFVCGPCFNSRSAHNHFFLIFANYFDTAVFLFLIGLSRSFLDQQWVALSSANFTWPLSSSIALPFSVYATDCLSMISD